MWHCGCACTITAQTGQACWLCCLGCASNSAGGKSAQTVLGLHDIACLTSNVRFSCWTCSTLLPMVAVVTTGCPRCRRYSTEVFPALSNPTSTSLYSLLGLKRDQMLAVQLDQAWPMHKAVGLLKGGLRSAPGCESPWADLR